MTFGSLNGPVLVSTGQDELKRQSSGDVITAKMINGKSYQFNRASAPMAVACC